MIGEDRSSSVVEIFGGICRVLYNRLKSTNFLPHNLRRYCTKVYQMCTRCRGITGIKPLKHVVIFQSFLKCQDADTDRFANFAQNWLPWQRPLKNRKNGSGSTTFTEIHSISWKKNHRMRFSISVLYWVNSYLAPFLWILRPKCTSPHFPYANVSASTEFGSQDPERHAGSQDTVLSVASFIALCDHNPIDGQTDRLTDGPHARSVA